VAAIAGTHASGDLAERKGSLGGRGKLRAGARLQVAGAILSRWQVDERDGVVYAIVTSYLPAALDGWDWCVDDVEAWLEVLGERGLTAGPLPCSPVPR